MTTFKNIKVSLFAIAATLLSGCAVVPTEINVENDEVLVSFETVHQAIVESNEGAAIGEKARWGGKIVSVSNKKDVSEIEIVYFPESRNGRPQLDEQSSGRFKAVVEGFVDPIVFEEGRIITVVGDVGDVQTGIIGEQNYFYATINAMGYHLWKEVDETQVDTRFVFSPFGYPFGYHRGFFSLWYDPWNRSSRFTIRSKKYNGHSQGGYSRKNKNRNNTSGRSGRNDNNSAKRSRSGSSSARSHSVDKQK